MQLYTVTNAVLAATDDGGSTGFSIVTSLAASALFFLLVYYLSPYIRGVFDKRKRYIAKLLREELREQWDGPGPPPNVRIVYKRPIRPIRWGLRANYTIIFDDDDDDKSSERALRLIRWDEINKKIADIPGGSEWLHSHGGVSPYDEVQPDD